MSFKPGDIVRYIGSHSPDKYGRLFTLKLPMGDHWVVEEIKGWYPSSKNIQLANPVLFEGDLEFNVYS